VPCRSLLPAVQGPDGGKPTVYKQGQRPTTLAEGYQALDLPCGQCVGCRLEKSRQWGIRIACEAAYLWEELNLPSTFVTLTYDEQHLPMYGSLVPQHFQNFIKRLRRHTGEKVRYYGSGEYGTTCPKHGIKECPACGGIQRPHYHAIILGYGFPDKYYVGDREGYPIYESDLLGNVWDKGFHEIGQAEFQSAAYCARYIMKKQTGPGADPDHYMRYDPLTDAWNEVEPEFSYMSKRPGIGSLWLGFYWDDVYPSDEMPIPGRGIWGTPPKYYDELVEKWDLDANLSELKEKRRREMAKSLIEGPSMESRALVQDAKLNKLGRNL
jgi:hypothetical protein